MPIVLNQNLPAYRVLRDEGMEVAPSSALAPRGTPVLRVALLNLMPEKTATETQIARLLGQSSHWVDLTLFVPDSYCSKTAPAAHMAEFYRRWSHIRGRRFDGLIVTGAPVETLPFEDVSYWSELTAIFDWARQRVGRSYYICWAAQAALRHFHGVPKRNLPSKMFGVYAHQVLKPNAPLMRGLAEGFSVPVSRHTEVVAADLPRARGIEVLASSEQAGLCLLQDSAQRAYYMFNHLEYDAGTLAEEYERDLRTGRPGSLPWHYFPHDDPARDPVHNWRGSARTLFRNWLNLVARHARPQDSASPTIEWLLGQDTVPAPVGIASCDFLIGVEDHPTAVPSVLRVLAGMGLIPTTLRVTEDNKTRGAIHLRLTGIGMDRAERVARRVLRGFAGTRSVSYRDTTGSGGIMVSFGEFGPKQEVRAESRGESLLPGFSAA